jgi:regulation of enolase protein 1 (concanavalin A-like superfamily)
MSVGPTPSLNFIGDTVGDVAPHRMSDMYDIRFANGQSPASGTIRLSDFRNQTLTTAFDEQAKIQASDKQFFNYLGVSVAISDDGNTAIAGAYGVGGTGAAYIFTRSGTTWTEQAKIHASDKQQNDYFGQTVAISDDGNTAIVGAPYEDPGDTTDAGAAYIFTRSNSNWTQQQKIHASDKYGYDNFGVSVDISSDGNTAIVGAQNQDQVGAAYIFTRSNSNWTQQQKIQASDKQQYDRFGISVAISDDGNTAIVGAAYEHADTFISAGAAYIFTRSNSNWTQQQKIRASDKQQYDLFGYSVDISSDGNTAIVGTIGEDGNTDTVYDAGAAYIFTRSGTNWSEQQKIQASDKQNYDEFGFSVSISGDGNTAIVGAHGGDGDTGSMWEAGAAYIFTRSNSNWSQKEKIQASDKQESDRFGRSVAISKNGNTAIVGAYFEDTGASNAGAVYVFENDGYYIRR